MKKVFESLRLTKVIAAIKKFIKKKRRKDDDLFDHPFAIF